MPFPQTNNNPEIVADRVLRRAEFMKMARKLQSRLALAQFKAKRGWEDYTLDTIELKIEHLRRQRRLTALKSFRSLPSSRRNTSQGDTWKDQHQSYDPDYDPQCHIARKNSRERSDLHLAIPPPPTYSRSNPRQRPKTPPSTPQTLSSSLDDGPHTPSQIFNFADFVNITPSSGSAR
ncbi:hypothetical protein VE03_01624 [Pseudogymnoascus sp. 23342-1-I1]|nr:hypothetical protein VE03_01624 [Pseudogymnoascus sp. 23342-1-I1]